MEVLMVYNFDPLLSEPGGGRRYVENLVNQYSKMGISVILLGIKKTNLMEEKYEDLKYKFIPVTKRSFLNRGDPGSWWKYFLKLMRISQSIKISDSAIIHTHHPLFMLPFIRSKKTNPKVCTFHGVPLDWVKVNYGYLYPFVKPIYQRIERCVIENVDMITTAGSYPKFGLEMRYPHLDLDKKIKVIPSGVDVDKFRPMNKYEIRKKYNLDRFDNIIVFAGRLSEQKNLELLLKSFLIVENTLKNSAIVIVGRGEKEEELKHFSKKLGIKNIIFTGEVKTEEVTELLNCADVFALTSWYEASPTVIKEALACGIPVVSTNVGDVSEIITDPLLGTVVNEYDEKLFADALLRTIEVVEDKPEEVKEKCREVALQRFSFEKVAKEFLAIYEKAMTVRGQK